MEERPQLLRRLGRERRVAGMGAGGTALERPQAQGLERLDDVAHALVGAAQGTGDLGHPLAAGTGEQDLAAAQHEGIGRVQAGRQLLALAFCQGTDEHGLLHALVLSHRQPCCLRLH